MQIYMIDECIEIYVIVLILDFGNLQYFVLEYSQRILDVKVHLNGKI